MKTYELNRKTYKDVKKMDHGQMSEFCESQYKRGYEVGKQEVPGLSNEEITQAILQAKGIGEKKVDAITAALEKAMELKLQKHGKNLIEGKDKN